MGLFEDRIIRLFEALHPLDSVPRAGYLLRGVPAPESVAAHSHFVSLLTLLFVRQYPEQFDAPKALAMALIHDLPEARLMDIPMPAGDAFLGQAKAAAEQAIIEDLFRDLDSPLADLHHEMLAAETPEARLIRGLDKAQMMIKIISYQREGRGHLDEFWNNPKNFADYGLVPVSRLFDAVCTHAGRPRPAAD